MEGELEKRGFGLTDLEYRMADSLLDMVFLHFGHWPLSDVECKIPYVRSKLMPLMEHLDLVYDMRNKG